MQLSQFLRLATSDTYHNDPSIAALPSVEVSSQWSALAIISRACLLSCSIANRARCFQNFKTLDLFFPEPNIQVREQQAAVHREIRSIHPKRTVRFPTPDTTTPV